MNDLAQTLADPEKFLSLLKIVDKRGQVVPLVLNSEQRELLRAYKSRGNKHLLVLKPRQIGSSTFWTALLFWLWYTSTDALVLYSMSHTMDSARQMMRMYRTYWKHLPELLKNRPTGKWDTDTMELLDSGAKLEVRTAGGKGGARSFTCNVIHMSEFAFYDDPDEVMASSMAALNDGLLIIESTANYFGDALHQRITQATTEPQSWQYRFFRWCDHEEYNLRPGTLRVTEEEANLMGQHQLSKAQIYWRRKKIQAIGLSKFKREYPLTLDEAYTLDGNSWLTSQEVDHLESHEAPEQGSYVFEEPKPGERYALGADVALGVGQDHSVIYVVNARTLQPAYVFRSNTITPVQLARKCEDISTRYNRARILVEFNNHGIACYTEFQTQGVWNLWEDEDGKYFVTTRKTKRQVLEHLRALLGNQTITQVDFNCLAQLRSLQVVRGDKILFPKNARGHADNVMALALAYWNAKDMRPEPPRSDYWKYIDSQMQKQLMQSRTRGHRLY